jgi:hypothetical protein
MTIAIKRAPLRIPFLVISHTSLLDCPNAVNVDPRDEAVSDCQHWRDVTLSLRQV